MPVTLPAFHADADYHLNPPPYVRSIPDSHRGWDSSAFYTLPGLSLLPQRESGMDRSKSPRRRLRLGLAIILFHLILKRRPDRAM